MIPTSVYCGLQIVYNKTIRRYLPRAINIHNGVAVPDRRLLDISDWQIRETENESVELLSKAVLPSDSVVIIGGGWGVTAVRAARVAESVTVFEAGIETAERVEEVANINCVSDTVEVRHAVIGEVYSARGNYENAPVLQPRELPECDVLEVDCEGAEAHIIPALKIRPREIIVEYHEKYGTNLQWAKRALQNIGYKILEHKQSDSPEIGNLRAKNTLDAEGCDFK